MNDKSEKYALKSATGNPLGLSALEKPAAPEAVNVPTVVGFQNPVATPATIAIGLLFCPKSCPVMIVDGPEKSANHVVVIFTELMLVIFVEVMFVVPLIVKSFPTVTIEVLRRICCNVPKVNCGKTVT